VDQKPFERLRPPFEKVHAASLGRAHVGLEEVLLALRLDRDMWGQPFEQDCLGMAASVMAGSMSVLVGASVRFFIRLICRPRSL